MLFRFLFKHGDKIRLTWEWDGKYSWGSGGQIYQEITSDYLDPNDPFNIKSIEKLKKEWGKEKWNDADEYIYRYIKMIPNDAIEIVKKYHQKNASILSNEIKKRDILEDKNRKEVIKKRLDIKKKLILKLKKDGYKLVKQDYSWMLDPNDPDDKLPDSYNINIDGLFTIHMELIDPNGYDEYDRIILTPEYQNDTEWIPYDDIMTKIDDYIKETKKDYYRVQQEKLKN
jgi:hypothetical protein